MNYKIGRITNTHGIKGYLIVRLLTDFERFEKNKEVYLFIDNEKINLKIKAVKNHNKGILVLFDDYEDINLVLKFKGLDVYTDEKPKLLEDEYHFEDLINKKVYNQNDNFIGIINEVINVPQGHLIRVKVDDKTKLIPFNKEFIISVDDKVVIKEIEGLL